MGSQVAMHEYVYTATCSTSLEARWLGFGLVIQNNIPRHYNMHYVQMCAVAVPELLNMLKLPTWPGCPSLAVPELCPSLELPGR